MAKLQGAAGHASLRAGSYSALALQQLAVKRGFRLRFPFSGFQFRPFLFGNVSGCSGYELQVSCDLWGGCAAAPNAAARLWAARTSAEVTILSNSRAEGPVTIPSEFTSSRSTCQCLPASCKLTELNGSINARIHQHEDPVLQRAPGSSHGF